MSARHFMRHVPPPMVPMVVVLLAAELAVRQAWVPSFLLPAPSSVITSISTDWPELWRATIANVVYQHLRNAAMHGFGTSAGIVLSQTTWNGQPVPILGLSELKRCARGLIAEARHRSEANWQWFGDDAIVRGV